MRSEGRLAYRKPVAFDVCVELTLDERRQLPVDNPQDGENQQYKDDNRQDRPFEKRREGAEAVGGRSRIEVFSVGSIFRTMKVHSFDLTYRDSINGRP